MGISLTYIKNNKRPRINSYGTPHDILETSEEEFSKFTLNLRFDRSDWNYLTVWSEKPIMLNLFKSMSWLIVSNAFWRSIKIIPVSNPSSKPFKILSFIKMTVSVLNYWTWTKTTPQEKQFFWSNPYKIKVMLTSLIEML